MGAQAKQRRPAASSSFFSLTEFVSAKSRNPADVLLWFLFQESVRHLLALLVLHPFSNQCLRKMKMGTLCVKEEEEHTLPVLDPGLTGKRLLSLGVHKETDCLRTGYLHVLLSLSFFEFTSASRIHRACYLRQRPISIRGPGQGALLWRVCSRPDFSRNVKSLGAWMD